MNIETDLAMSKTEQLEAQVAMLNVQLQALTQRQQVLEQQVAEAATAAALNGPAGVDANVRMVLEQHTMMFNQLMYQQANMRVALEQQTVTFTKMAHELKEEMRDNNVNAKNLIDTETMVKPQKFNGQDDDFRNWSVKFIGFISRVWQEAKTVLEWAGENKGVIHKEDLTAKWISELDKEMQFDGIYEFNRQLYTILLDLTEGEALDVVTLPEGANGIESWRRLVRRFDPATAVRSQNVMLQILNPGTYNVHEMIWTRKVGRED